jgi:hypothetical protein
MTNQYKKYEKFVINSFLDNKQKPFWHLIDLVTLTFDLVTPKAIQIICCLWPITMWNMKTLWWILFKKISGNYVVYRQTDRQTLAKQFTHSSSKGGIIICCMFKEKFSSQRWKNYLYQVAKIVKPKIFLYVLQKRNAASYI